MNIKGLMAIGLLVCSASVHAQQTTYVFKSYLNLSSPIYVGPVTGQITLPAPLPPNVTNYTVPNTTNNQGAVVPNTIDWAFDGAFVTGILNSNFLLSLPGTALSQNATFVFSTDKNGAITAWTVTVTGSAQVGIGVETETLVISSALGDNYTLSFDAPSCGFVPCPPYTAATPRPGAWWTSPPLPVNVDVLYCLPGGVDTFKVVPPSNLTSSAVRNPADPRVVYCALPSEKPPTWQIKVTYDHGDTWTWVTLSSLGLGD